MIEAVVGVALRAILASVLLGGALAALVLLATRTLALTAATRHALWTSALVATALMPVGGIGVSLARATVAAAPATSPVTLSKFDAAASSAQTSDFTAFAIVDGTAPAPTAAPSKSFAERLALADRLAFAAWTPRVSRALALGVVGLWALGALIGLIGLAASVARVRGLKRRSSPLDGALADELPWLTEVGPGREIYLRLSYETETPVAIGFRRPVILIPTELATADGLAAIEPLILHEHAHLRRNDDWTNLLQRAIERVFWFNPLVWFLGRRIALEREIASDDAVVEKTGEAHAYATSLWKLVREMRMPEHAVVAPGALLTRKQITVRIEQLLDKKRARLHRSPVAALGVALAGVLAVAFVATSAPAVELPVAPETDPPAIAPTAHAHLQHGRNTAAHGKLPVKRVPIVTARTSTQIVSKSASNNTGATTAHASWKAMHAQLQLLRAQLAAAKARSASMPVTTIRIAHRKQDAALPAPPFAKFREVPPVQVAAGAMPAIAPMPVFAPRADGRCARFITKLQSVTAAVAARVRDETDIERAINAAMATIPTDIEVEMSSGSTRSTRNSRNDRMKLTYKMVASNGSVTSAPTCCRGLATVRPASWC